MVGCDRRGSTHVMTTTKQALNEIQSLLAGQEIPAVSTTSLRDEGRPLGYVADSGQLRGLAMRNRGLRSMPGSIGTLDRLRALLLNGNALTSLPESIRQSHRARGA